MNNDDETFSARKYIYELVPIEYNHYVFNTLAGDFAYALAQAIRAALQQQAHVVEIDEGELWSFLRHVLSQGEAIWQDNREKCYEEYSAHLDYAARVRKQQLVAILKGAKRDQAVAAKDGAG